MSVSEQDELVLNAYLDGELGPIDAARFEQRLAKEPRLAAEVDARRALVLHPAAQHVCDARIGVIGVVRRVRMIHRHDVGDDGRTNIVVVVGGDAHALRRLDEESGMADESKPQLIAFERGKTEAGELWSRRLAGDKADAGLAAHFRFGRRGRGALRKSLRQTGEQCAGRKNKAQPRPTHDVTRRSGG